VNPAEDESEEIVVTASRTEESRERAVLPVQVVTREEIVRSGARTLADLLETVAGVQVLEGRSGPYVSIRGSEPDHVLLVVDGARVVGRVDGGVDLRRLSVDDVEQIEIAPGAGSTVWGSDALAGVIQIRTRRPPPGLRGSVRLEAGRVASPSRTTTVPASLIPVPSLDNTDMVVRLEGGGSAARVGVTAAHHSGAAWDQTPEEPGTTGDGWRQSRGALQADLDAGRAGRWALNADVLAYRRRGVDATPAGAVLDREQSGQQVLASIIGDTALGGSHRLHTLASYSGWSDQLLVDQRNSDLLDSYQRVQDRVGQGRVAWTAREGVHQADGGAELHIEHLVADRLESGEASRTRAAGWVQHRWGAAETLIVTSGARLDLDAWFGLAVSPRLAMAAFPSPRLTLRASAGRGFAAPDPREMFLDFTNPAVGYRVLGNPSLKPETASGGQGSMTWRPAGPWVVEASGSMQTVDQLIQPTSDDGVSFQYTNIAAARLLQAALDVGWQPHDRVRLSANLGWLDARDTASNLPLDNRPRWQGGAVVDLTGRPGGLTARWMSTSRRRFTLADGPITTAAAHLVDLRVFSDPARRASLAVGIDNLLDAGRAQGGLLPTQPRRFYLGLEGQFTHTRKENP
jgi:outer membrane receptor for ferrienterochelin and colicins